jgi:Alginate export
MTVIAVLLAGRAASAQPTDNPQVTAYFYDTTRVESWSFFQPLPGGGDPNYSIFGNRATLGVRLSSRHMDADAAVQYAQLLGLPPRAIGPGALGSGGFYYFSAEAPEAFQLYLKTMMMRLKAERYGISLTLGRMGFSSGEENSSGTAAIDALTQTRVGSRMVGEFEWSVFQRAFDGARLDVDRPSWSANAALLFPTQGGYEESANPTNSSVKVMAGSATAKPVILRHQQAQVFVYHYRDQRDVTARPDNTSLPADAADVDMTTFGFSDVAVVPLGRGELDAVLWAAWQNGNWYGDKHAASSVAVEAGYNFVTARWQPWVRVGYVFASGDRSAADGRHETFFQMVPSIDRYARSTTYALMNVRDLFAQIAIQPHARVRASGEAHRVSLANATDRWYYGSGATSRTGSFFGFTGRFAGAGTRIGTVVEGTADVSLNRVWSLKGYVGWIDGGDVVERLFAGDRLVFFSLDSVIRF